METIEKPTLYYIKGVEGRQEECIKALEAKGAQNTFEIDRNCKLPCLFYIDDENIIDVVFPNSDIGRLIINYGTELHLPKKSNVLKWEDIISNNKGLYQIIQEMDEDKETYRIASIWPTRRQALSAQAASLISQIREQRKDVYGELPERYSVDKSNYACVIVKTVMNSFVIECGCTYHGGLLRFQTKEQAQLFLENNRELVEEYLKTF